MAEQIVRIDGIKWWVITKNGAYNDPVPLCPDHDLRMTEHPTGKTYYKGRIHDRWDSEALQLECAEGPHLIDIPREFSKEKRYVLDCLNAKIFKNMDIIDLDGELTPVAKAKDKNSKYFATAQIMDSKRGPQVVIYAGKKGKKSKTQIIIDPNNKKLSFDHKDIKPTDTFLEVRATFDDGSTHILKKDNK